MTIFVVNYVDESDAGEIQVNKEYDGRAEAERQARYISKKRHKGGYDGPLVYVFAKHSPTGQRVFFAGRTDSIEGDYLND
jgi:hypothetical protein